VIATTMAAERLRMSVMAMTDSEQRALGLAVSECAQSQTDHHFRAFWGALCTLIDEAAGWSKVRDVTLSLSVPEIIDPFDWPLDDGDDRGPVSP